MFKLENCVALVTSSASKILANHFNDMLMKHGISRTQWIALYYLNNAKMNQKEFASKVNIKSSSAVRLIDRMERDGLIARERDEQDRRISYLNITDAGKEKIESLLYLGELASCKFTQGIAPEELDTFSKVLKKLVANVTEDTPDNPE